MNVQSKSRQMLILIPTYNERENIAALIGELAGAVPEAEILVLDDGSPDGTADVVEELEAERPRVRVLRREGVRGLGRAYLDGFRLSLADGFDVTVCMDADFSHDPEVVPQLVKCLQDGADAVVGSRYISGGRILNWPLNRLLLSRGAAVYTRLVTGLPVRDPTGGFNVYSRRALEMLPLDRIDSDGYAFQIEIKYTLWKLGCRIDEVPIVFTERREGRSKLHRGIVGEAIGLVWRLRRGVRR
ncbi:MAG: polyprenol monophosphomannose synthase [Verrucomicrobia bacterium]|nr:polyprenol monophosphomannose synthase [Verrucomicrobiota bacterium]MCH8525770.1 polyprenol monophosphomannose synthase [Kiritimatiellia bacterium]